MRFRSFEGEQRIVVLDVEDSFVVAREVVFKSWGFKETTHAYKGRVSIRIKLKCTMGQT